MIKEAYCSFEVSKLLKEKGFPQDYDIYHSMIYNEKDYEDEYEVQRMVTETRLVKAGTLSSYPVGVPEPKCYAPTHQMAIAWLREVHKVNIEIHYNRFGENYKYLIIYKPEVLDDIRSLGVYFHYEEAVEAALKYVLENLI